MNKEELILKTLEAENPSLAEETRNLLFKVFACFGLFILGCFLTLPRAAETLQNSDGGDFVMHAVAGGVAHPPGYPVYMFISSFLVKLSQLAPYHTLSSLSAILNSAAAALLCLLCYRIGGSLLISISIGFAWLVHEPSLRIATDVEVFALHSLLVVVLLHTAQTYRTTTRPTRKRTFMLGAMFGLAAAHHHLIILWLPLVIAVLFDKGKSLSGKEGVIDQVGVATLGSLMGIIPYFYLFLAHFSAPDLSFAPVNGLGAFLIYVLRLGYGTFSISAGAGPTAVSYLPHFLEVTVPYLPLQCLSIVLLIGAFITKRTSFGLGLIFSLFLHLLFATRIILPNDVEVYGEWAMRFYPTITIAMSIALAYSLRGFNSFRSGIIALTALIAVFPLLHVTDATERADARQDKAVNIEIKQIFRELPGRSVLIVSSDRIAFGTAYLQHLNPEVQGIAIITEGKLGSKFYRERIQKQWLFLENLSDEDISDVRNIAAAAHQSKVPVFSYSRKQDPKGWKLHPVGSLSQWLPEDYEIPESETLVRLLEFCLFWPKPILETSEVRIHSQYIIREHLVLPLAKFFAKSKDPKVKSILRDVHLSFQNRNIGRAIKLCELRLSEITSRATQPHPYPLEKPISVAIEPKIKATQEKPAELSDEYAERH